MDAKQEIKMRLPIDELVGQYCQLQRKGRNFVCVCPFHNDTHPSMLVSPDKGIAYCFACNSGGDIFSFYQKIEGVDFPQAIKDLADKAGVTLPKETFHQKGPKKDEKERLRACLEEASKFFMEQLGANVQAKEYLASRGVDDKLRDAFGIGYAPDSFNRTYEALLKAGFSRREIVDAGLAVQKDVSGDQCYDRFRHRIMFPIHDHHGHLVGFGGRALKPDDAKYVNSPEGKLYSKSSVLYGLHQAKEGIRTDHSVVLVEGYFDVVASHKAGLTNVVAVSGTAFTREHGKLLKRYAEKAILCLDQDRAGEDARHRAFQILSKEGVGVHSVALPVKDPDEMVQKDPGAYATIVRENSLPYIDALLLVLAKTADTPQGKKSAMETILPLLDSLGTAVEREAYVEKASEHLGISISALTEDLKRWQKGEKSHSPATESAIPIEKTPFSRGELILGLALLYPQHRDLLSEVIHQKEDETKDLFVSLTSVKGNAQEAIKSLEIPETVREKLSILLLFCEEHFQQWSEQLARRELKKLCMAANREVLRRKQQSLIEQIKQSRAAGRKDEEIQLLTQYQQSLKLMKIAS